MSTIIRPVIDSDWLAILSVANRALPDAQEENKEWWQIRQALGTLYLRRRQYVAEDADSGEVIGYGALEEGPEKNMFRLFTVVGPIELERGLAEEIYDRLRADLQELNAEIAWIREESRDPIVEFFRNHDFEERTRFTLPNGREAIVLGRRLS